MERKLKNRIFIKILCLILIQFYSVNCFKEWWEDSKVFNLNTENFLEHVGKDKYVVVKFYTKWCRYCRILCPIYEDFFNYMKINRDDVLVARLEGEANLEIIEEYDLHAFPRVALFHPHSLEISSIFDSKRNLENLIAWVEIDAPKIEENDNINFMPIDLQILELKNNIKFINDKFANLSNKLIDIKSNKVVGVDNFSSSKKNFNLIIIFLSLFMFLFIYFIHKYFQKIY